jgi:hypothetical protein
MRLIVNPNKYGNNTGSAPQIRNTEFEMDASYVGVPTVKKPCSVEMLVLSENKMAERRDLITVHRRCISPSSYHYDRPDKTRAPACNCFQNSLKLTFETVTKHITY